MAERDRLLAALADVLPGASIDDVVGILLNGEREQAARVARDLGERVKELTALHRVASLLQSDALSEEELLAQVAAALPPAFLHPQDAVARVAYGDVSRETPGFAAAARRLRSPFRTSDGKEGALEVGYRRAPADEAQEPFLAEERRLLDSLADMMATALARRRSSERLRLLVGTGRVRLFAWDLASDRVVWPGNPDGSTPSRDRSMTREETFRAIHAEDRESLARTLDAAVAEVPGAVEFAAEFRAAFAPGEYRWRHLTGHVIRDAKGRALRVIGISSDITDQRLLQDRLRQGQKMEALGRLAGGVAHDFNNILAAILGFAQLCEMEMPKNDPLRENVDEIIRAGESATALVRQILAFGRRQELRPTRADLRRLLEESEGMIGRLLGKRVQLRHEFAADAPLALVDPHQFQQVVLNLSVNARDAMNGGGTIVLRVRKATRGQPRPDGGTDAPRDWAALEVEDNGCGMPPEVRERIFEPFFTTKEEGKGTGLGLSTVHGIVLQSGGFLEVESEVGRGTLIRAHFPVPAGS